MWVAPPSFAFSSCPVTAHSTAITAHHGLRCRAEAEAPQPHRKKKKVVVVGSGWAGLSSAHHLSKHGFDVTVIEARAALLKTSASENSRIYCLGSSTIWVLITWTT